MAETIQIMPSDPASQGEYVVINAEDFDPQRHTRYAPEPPKRTRKAPEAPQPPAPSDLV